MTEPRPITCDVLDGDLVNHGFFTRTGGVSRGIYDGLNVGLGSQDDRDAVVENRSRVAAALGLAADNLVTAYQVHSDKVRFVDGPFGEERPQVDALVTNQPDIALGILTADCGPVLFSDPKAGVIGGAHAGWKGATGGVLENTVLEMEKLGATRANITATLGPTISQASYEVGPEFADRLTMLDPDNSRYLVASAKPGHAMFDLPGYIVDRLDRFNVDARWTGHCTYANEERFYSYRRCTHRNEPDYGRQIAAIALKI